MQSAVQAVIFALMTIGGVHGFFQNQENIYAPINSASLLINELLVNTANVSALLDENIDHIHQPVGDYPSLEERSDYYLGNEYAVRVLLNYGFYYCVAVAI